jgi:predicted nuclease of predicted toxin-antitoxin system
MKLLIDECLPRTLKRLLGDHECRTVQEMGWSGKKNVVLLSLAELEFDFLVTVDQGIEYEQNLANRKLVFGINKLRSGEMPYFGANEPCSAEFVQLWCNQNSTSFSAGEPPSLAVTMERLTHL